jgi:hypothetical protein
MNILRLEDRAGVSQPEKVDPAATNPSTQPTVTRSVPIATILSYAIPAMDFLGILFVIVLSVVLLLLVTIMLVGRLIGVSHVTSAFVWSVLLIVFLFPWQAFLIRTEHYQTYGVSGYESARYTPAQPAFKVPGVLYTYPELAEDYDFQSRPFLEALLKWGRYVGFPVLALLILMMVQAKSSRGLRFALGEADITVDVTTRPNEPTL